MPQHPKLEILDGQDQTVVRGRPGRRSAEDRTQAVLDLLAGKASIDAIARRLGVSEATVLGWRDEAAEAIAATFRRGTAKSADELALTKENKALREVVTDLTIENTVMKRALDSRPSRPGRSPR